MDVINIKAIKCFIINTTPMLSDNCGNAYEIHRCGLPSYHVLPHYNDHFFGHGCEYHGFGMYPCCHKNWHANLHPHYDYFYRNPYGRYCLKCVNHGPKPFEFIAPVKALPERNKVRVFFPASAQLLCGLYSLTFVIDLYEPGYHCNNLRTITVDYNNVFELVPNMEGAAGDITIDIDKQIGLNDSFMIGNNVQTSSAEQNNTIQGINIIGPSDVKVGDIAIFKTSTTPFDSNAVTFTLSDTGCALLGAQVNNTAQIYGQKVNNVVDGKNTVYLSATSTDGGNVTAQIPVTIHNYATDINLSGYGDEFTINYDSSITTDMYVTQEDGTRVAICERGGCCQAIENGTVSVISGDCVEITFGKEDQWTYDGDESQNCEGGCCKENSIIIKNINNTRTVKDAVVRIKSNLKDANGQYISKDITIHCLGTTGSLNGDVADVYVTDGHYDAENDRIVLTRTDDTNVNVSLDGLREDIEPDYWYTDNITR